MPLTGYVLGYFLAGGLAGALSRTATAPFDRLKVYLIAQTQTRNMPRNAAEAVVKGEVVKAAKKAAGPIRKAVLALWRAGGVRSFFAGNGLNIAKVLPESAIRFGSFEVQLLQWWALGCADGPPGREKIPRDLRRCIGC